MIFKKKFDDEDLWFVLLLPEGRLGLEYLFSFNYFCLNPKFIC